MGLGFQDGFQPALAFWEHWCKGENDMISTEEGYPCNWCGLTEEDMNDGD